MEGKFVKKQSFLMLAILILGGVALVLMGVKLFQWELDAGLRIMLLALWGVAAICYLGFLALLYLTNRGAYLRLSEDGVDARYGLNRKLQCKLSELSYIAVGPAMLTMEAEGTLHDVAGLSNSGELAQWLKKQIPFVVPREDRQTLLTQRTAYTAKRKGWVIAMVVACVMLFVNILLVGFATGGRELTAFTQRDLVLFGIFLIAELLSVAAAFFCARVGGRYIRLLTVNHDKLRILAIARSPLPEGDAIGVFYDGYAQRLTLYADASDRIYYITEKLGKDFLLHTHDSCEPVSDTWEIDEKINSMRDIGFLFGFER